MATGKKAELIVLSTKSLECRRMQIKFHKNMQMKTKEELNPNLKLFNFDKLNSLIKISSMSECYIPFAYTVSSSKAEHIRKSMKGFH